jgi:DNA-binding NtrC family response regulator
VNDEEQPAMERRLVGASSAMDAVRDMIVHGEPMGSAALNRDEGGSGRELAAATVQAGSPRANGNDAGQGPAADSTITLPIGSSLFDVERAFIVATLEHFAGDKRRAASALGCSVKTLYNKLHLYRRQMGDDATTAAGSTVTTPTRNTRR